MKRTLAFLFATLLATQGLAQDPATQSGAESAPPAVEPHAESAEVAESAPPAVESHAESAEVAE